MNMDTTNHCGIKRKLIDLPENVIGILSEIAKEQRMSVKAYIERVVIERATNNNKLNQETSVHNSKANNQ